MPELPEVETIRLGLQKRIIGKTLQNIEVLNPKTFIGDPKKVQGQKVLNIERKAKMLLINLSGDLTLVFHLKMTGQLVFIGHEGEKIMGGHPTENMLGEMPSRDSRAIFHFTDGSNLYFNDQIKFGWVKLVNTSELMEDSNKILGKLGPEPLEKSFTWEVLKEVLMKRKKTPVKVALMDQSVISGVGNIYASEALFLARVDPRKIIENMKDEEFRKLHKGIIDSLNESIKYGGTTIKNYVNVEGERGEFIKFASVYGRTGQKCKGCPGKIVKITQAGRGTYFCPSCQK